MGTKSKAIFSADRLYRYLLSREINPNGKGTCCFVMLNPSTADEINDDPTIRRCIGYAKEWGYQYLDVLNIFAYRSTDPGLLKIVKDPVGPENDSYIQMITKSANLVVCAWGKHGGLNNRGEQVISMIKNDSSKISKNSYLKLNLNGSPSHPLYLSKSLKPIYFY